MLTFINNLTRNNPQIAYILVALKQNKNVGKTKNAKTRFNENCFKRKKTFSSICQTTSTLRLIK